MALHRWARILAGSVAVSLATILASCRLPEDSSSARPEPGAEAKATPPEVLPGPTPPEVEVRPPLPSGEGIVTGRLVRGTPTNSLDGEISVEFPGCAPVSARTGSRGTFRFEGLPAGIRFTLRAKAAGCLPLRIRGLRIPENRRFDAGDLELGAGTPLSVLVTSGAVEPLAGATVSLHRFAPESLEDDAENRESGVDRWADPLDSRVTDAEGRVEFPAVAPGGVLVRIGARNLANGLRWIRFGDGEAVAPVRMHLLPLHSLEGRVRRPDGSPVPGAAVRIDPPGYTAVLDPSACRAITDAEGRYRIDGVPSGGNDLFVRYGRTPELWVANLRIPDVPAYDITLRPGVTLRGRVVEDAGGAPIPGATVRILVGGSRIGGRLASSVAKTGADGGFEWIDLPVEGIADLSVRRAGFVPCELEDLGEFESRSVGDVVEREVRLRKGGVIRGTVTDPEGRPVSGAVVTSDYVPEGRGYTMLSFLGRCSTRSEEDGTYVLAPCVPGASFLTAAAAGLVGTDGSGGVEPVFRIGNAKTVPWETEVVAGEETRRDVVLGAAGVVEGAVAGESGQPLRGLSVWIPGDSRHSVLARGRATDAEGRFRIEGIPPGAGRVVRAAGPGLGGRSATFDVGAGGGVGRISVTVGTSRVVEGRLRDRDGAPLVDPVVHLEDGDLIADRRPYMRMDPLFGPTRTPDRDGTFRFEDVEPGDYSIVAFAREHAPAVLTGILVAEAEDVRGLDVVLSTGSELRGTVEDDAGRPVEGATVAILETPGLHTDGEVRAVTGPDGRFAIRHVAEGPGEFVVRTDGRPELRRVTRTGETDPVLALVPGRRISGVVVDSVSGAGVRDVEVLVTDPGVEDLPFRRAVHEKRLAVRTDREGGFSVGPLADGAYTVIVGPENSQADRDYAPLRVNGVKAGTEDARLELVPGMSIAGRLVDPESGAIRARMRLTLTPRDEKGKRDFDHRVQDRTRGDGTFRVTGLRQGRYDIRVEPDAIVTAMGEIRPIPYVRTMVRSVEAGTKDLEIAMLRGLPIEGRVLDSAGNPSRGGGFLDVTRAKGGTASPFESEHTMVMDDGTFETPPLPADGTYDLRVGPGKGLAPGSAAGIKPGTKDVIIRLPAGAVISGRVLLPDGRPAPEGMAVEARSTDHEGDFESTTGKDGTFRITGVQGTEFRVVAGGGESDFAPAAALAKPGDTGVEIRLTPGLTVSGVLVDIEGRALRGVSLNATQHKPLFNIVEVVTAADGTFLVKGLAPGPFELSTGLVTGIKLGKFEVPAKDLRDLRVVLSPK